MGTIVPFNRMSSGARAVSEIISSSLTEYTNQIARAMLTVEQLQSEDHRQIADTIVAGWVAWCQLEAGSTRRTERERETFAFVGMFARGGSHWQLAAMQVGEILAGLMAAQPVAQQN